MIHSGGVNGGGGVGEREGEVPPPPVTPPVSRLPPVSSVVGCSCPLLAPLSVVPPVLTGSVHTDSLSIQVIAPRVARSIAPSISMIQSVISSRQICLFNLILYGIICWSLPLSLSLWRTFNISIDKKGQNGFFSTRRVKRY